MTVYQMVAYYRKGLNGIPKPSLFLFLPLKYQTPNILHL